MWLNVSYRIPPGGNLVYFPSLVYSYGFFFVLSSSLLHSKATIWCGSQSAALPRVAQHFPAGGDWDSKIQKQTSDVSSLCLNSSQRVSSPGFFFFFFLAALHRKLMGRNVPVQPCDVTHGCQRCHSLPNSINISP